MTPPRCGRQAARALAAICFASFGTRSAAAQAAGAPHPRVAMAPGDGAAIRAAAGHTPLLDRALAEAHATVDSALARPIDTPPPGEAGGYAHERHKQNYREMQAAGALYQVTGDRRYARFVRDVLEKYAVLYPTLGAHPLAKDQAPGKLFHQSLNEANWLLAASLAYDCVYDALTPAERARYEANVFRPMADWLSVKQAPEFDRIHNHGTWATAAVGTYGFVVGDTAYSNRALYGTKRDKSGGFLRQLDLLFSPDGYYMEGAYYVRYALLPFFQFATAADRNAPGVGVYAYRGGILRKALDAALQSTYPDGRFLPINDASRSMDVTSPETVLALDHGFARYAPNGAAADNLLAVAALQGEVTLDGAGLRVARALAARPAAPAARWPSAEFTDGADGTRGGLGILRSGVGRDATMLVMKYGVHGQGHGHFDKLHFMFYDAGREVVPDYGYARWINVEPKFGGRYLPENDSWAKQTLAHNTVVVDGRSQSNGVYRVDEAKAARRHFFDASDPAAQAVSAAADGFYDGVGMRRTMLLLRDRRLPYPVVVDLYQLTSAAEHAYDLPLHYRGQLVTTNVRYAAHSATRQALGTAQGYQHVWNEASGRADGPVQVTWLDGQRYYSLTTAGAPGTEVVFGRTGAADSSFNLVAEPMVLVRRRAAGHLFASVLEPHGYFSELEERSADARPRVRDVRVLYAGDDASAVEVTAAGPAGGAPIRWTVLVANGPASRTASHAVTAGGRAYTWTGNFAVQGLERAK